MATDIDVTYQWWLPTGPGMYQYGGSQTNLSEAEALFTTSGSMLPDESKLFKVEYVPLLVGLATVTRREVTELSLPPR